MSDPRTPDPRYDPAAPRAPLNPPYSDPALDPRITNQTVVQPSGGRSGLIAAGILAVLVVIGIVAFTSTPSTDPGTTAVIPEQTQETPAPELTPADPVAPAPDASAPLEQAPAEAAPTDQPPAADQ